MPIIDFAYASRDNSIDLILKNNGTAVDLAGATAIHLRLNSFLVTSTNSTATITWNQAGYETGEVRIHMGKLTSVSPDIYDGYLAVFDGSNPIGLVWGPIAIEQKADPLAT